MFRAALDHNLDQVSSRILATSPLPSLEETYLLRQVPIGAYAISETSTLAILKNRSRPASLAPSISLHLLGHYHNTTRTIDICWKLHNDLEWLKDKQVEKKKSAQIATTDASLSFASHSSQVTPHK